MVIVLPNTPTVESYFSRLSLENNEYGKALKDFSLDSVHLSKQFANLTGM